MCKVESGFKCGSLCQLIVYPSIIFEVNKSDKSFDEERVIRIKTDSLVSITGSINSIFSFKVNNCDNYSISYVDLTQYSDKFTYLFLELTLIFKSSVPDPELVC